MSKEKDTYYLDKKLKEVENIYAKNHSLTMNFLFDEIPDGRTSKIEAHEMVMYQGQTIDALFNEFKSICGEYRELMEKTGVGKLNSMDDLIANAKAKLNEGEVKE